MVRLRLTRGKNMTVGCYSLDIYCDGKHDMWKYSFLFPVTYTGRTLAACKRQAKKDGWRFLRSGLTLCSACVEGKVKASPIEGPQ
jgi:hypothetical protein